MIWPDEIDFEIPEPVNLFENFCAEFTCSLFKKGEFLPKKLQSLRKNWVKYRVPKRVAIEFVLRKDYLSDWAVELLEEYLYYTQNQFEHELSKRGFCILVSRPIFNPWIIKNRFKNQFACSTQDTAENLGFPPTNYFIAARKMSSKRSFLCVEEMRNKVSQGDFLKIKTYQNMKTLEKWDLVSRPHGTVELFIHCEEGGKIQTLLRQSYPRPIICLPDRSHQDSAKSDGFIAESISASFDKNVLSNTSSLLENESLLQLIKERSGVGISQIKSIGLGLKYLPSPGGMLETIRSLHIEVTKAESREALSDNHGIGMTQDLRWIEVQQILRANQVGGLLSSRAEISIYDTLISRKMKCDPWIGAELECEQFSKSVSFEAKSWRDINRPPLSPKEFQEIETTPEFLCVQRSTFLIPKDFDNVKMELEWIDTLKSSSNTIAIIPLFMKGTQHFVGIEKRKLPAFEILLNKSQVPCLPAWRIPKHFKGYEQTKTFVIHKTLSEFGLNVSDVEELGCPFFSSAGTTPERVTFLVANVSGIEDGGGLAWISLDDILANYREVEDGHLLIGIFRLCHALGRI